MISPESKCTLSFLTCLTFLLVHPSSSTRRESGVDSAYFIRNFVDRTYAAIMKRRILPPAEGFHLEILTEVTLASPLITASTSPSSLNCSLRLTETLPAGLYVDSFQLRNYHQFGGPRVVSESRVIDTEAPAFESRDERLWVYQPFRVDRERQRLVTQVVMPVHLRYHGAVVDGDATQITFGDPETHVACWKVGEDENDGLMDG